MLLGGVWNLFRGFWLEVIVIVKFNICKMLSERIVVERRWKLGNEWI